MFEITQLAVNETTDIHLRGPDDELLYDEAGRPVTITVNGPGTKAFAKAQQAKNKALMEYVRRGKNKPDTTLADNAEFLARVTVSFNNLQYKGMSVNGYEQFKACYLDQSIGFISEQVGKELADWSNFTKGSTKT
jgi:hypothetical protein